MDILFFIKKFIEFFVEPFGFILSLFLLGLFYMYKNSFVKAKFFLSFSFISLLLLSYPPFSNKLIVNLEKGYSKNEMKDLNISYIHVLGNANSDDTTQPLASMLSETSLKRVLEGVREYKRYPNAKLIFTGYEGDSTLANASINAKFAESLGVPKEMIIVNQSPRDTQEETLFSKTVIGDSPFLLVTSASHMRRAIQLFKSIGMKPIATPTDFERERNLSFFSVPNVESLENSQKAIHEYIGAFLASLLH